MSKISLQPVRIRWQALSQSVRARLRSERIKRLHRQAKKSRKKLATEFSKLASVPEKAKTVLNPRLRHYSNQLAVARMWQEDIESPVFIIFFVAFVLAVFYLPYAIVSHIPRPGFSSLKHSPGLSVLGVAAGLLLLLIPVIFGMAYSKLGKRFIAYSTITLIWFVLGLISALILGSYLIYETPNEGAGLLRLLVLAGMFGVVSFLASGMLFLAAADFLETRFERSTRRMFPTAVIVNELVDLLYQTETKSKRWPEVDFRRELLFRLNVIAVCIERHLSQSLLTDEEIVNGKIKETCARIAADVRATASSVVFSKRDTEETFKTYLTQCLIHVDGGQWGLMKQTKPQAVSTPKRLRTRAKAILTGVLSASIPLVGLVFLWRWSIVEGPLLGYLTGGSVAWAALSLISQLDPDYGNKLRALEKFGIPNPGKSSE
jgi:hypothetical protein